LFRVGHGKWTDFVLILGPDSALAEEREHYYWMKRFCCVCVCVFFRFLTYRARRGSFYFSS